MCSEICVRATIQIVGQLAAEFDYGVARALDRIARPSRHPTGPSGWVFRIDADDIPLKLVAPSARPAGEVPEVVCLHRVTDALAGTPQHDGAARQVDSLDERRGANEKPNLAHPEQPLYLESD